MGMNPGHWFVVNKVNKNESEEIMNRFLGGGSQFFSCSLVLSVEMIQFDVRAFFNGVELKPPTRFIQLGEVSHH